MVKLGIEVVKVNRFVVMSYTYTHIRGNRTYCLSIFARVWSCLTILIVAAFGIFVSSNTSTLFTDQKRVAKDVKSGLIYIVLILFILNE